MLYDVSCISERYQKTTSECVNNHVSSHSVVGVSFTQGIEKFVRGPLPTHKTSVRVDFHNSSHNVGAVSFGQRSGKFNNPPHPHPAPS